MTLALPESSTFKNSDKCNQHFSFSNKKELQWELQEWEYLDVIQSDHQKCTWNVKKIQSDHHEKFMHMKWKIYNGNTYFFLSLVKILKIVCWHLIASQQEKSWEREREGIEESNMKIIDRFSYSDGGTKVKSYFSEE